MATSKIPTNNVIRKTSSAITTTDGTSWETVMSFPCPKYGILMGVTQAWTSGKPTGIRVLVEGRSSPYYESETEGIFFSGFLELFAPSGATVTIQSRIATTTGEKSVECWLIVI